MTRRQEREFALQVLYGLEFNEAGISEMVDRLHETQKKKATEFSLKLISETVQNREELDRLIEERLRNWEYKRVAVIDKILLRMAIAEFLYFNSVPPQATLNEMIELSKEYGTERSSKFINGVLDAVLKKLRKENRINKTGRGLVH